VHSANGGKSKTFIFQMLLCKELLAPNRSGGSHMAQIEKGKTRHIRRSLNAPFAMEIIILMCWCIWIARNAWLFNEEDSSWVACKTHFKKEFAMVILRAKPSRVQQMENGSMD
jgi:hypothetical protein